MTLGVSAGDRQHFQLLLLGRLVRQRHRHLAMRERVGRVRPVTTTSQRVAIIRQRHVAYVKLFRIKSSAWRVLLTICARMNLLTKDLQLKWRY